MNCAALILAAGAASRMGQPKQLLRFGRTSLLQHSIQQAKEAGFARVCVVVGARADLIRQAIWEQLTEVVENSAWESGMGSSIVAGVRHLLEKGTAPDGIAILLGDQPLVESTHLIAMRETFEGLDAGIVAASYAGTLGVPAFFRSTRFEDLLQLEPDSGAVRILRRRDLDTVPFHLPEAATDIDTPEDWAAFQTTA